MVAATPAFAKPLGTSTGSVTSAGLTNAQISAMFHRDQVWFNNLLKSPLFEDYTLAQTQRLVAEREARDVAAAAANKPQSAAIRKMLLSGKYVVLNANLARVAALQNSISSLLAIHTGFNGDGTVSNSVLALDTVHSLDKQLADMQYYLNHATMGFNNYNHRR
jgi:hypothetical protein